MDESRDSIRAEASLPYGGLRVSSSRGGADIWRLGRGVVVIRLFGNGSSAFVKPIASAFTAAVEQGHLVRLFFEVAELVTYDSALRAELTRLLNASRYWDRKVNVLQVTDAKEHTLEIRALASAADASLAWDLRCEVREKLLVFLQQNYPQALPRRRAEITGIQGEDGAAKAHAATTV